MTVTQTWLTSRYFKPHLAARNRRPRAEEDRGLGRRAATTRASFATEPHVGRGADRVLAGRLEVGLTSPAMNSTQSAMRELFLVALASMLYHH